MSDLDAALSWIGAIDNSSGQICLLNTDGKPTMILFEFGCATCSEVASKNAEEYGNALVALVGAVPVLLAERGRLRSALAALVGAESKEELRQMEAIVRLTPAPDADKVAMLNAIHALLEIDS